uniref:Major facilitator superfamily (MFS) profile domain-containing protein n=1 Tax=Chromera velia CCMP2878 TaxID=1169474 RepID=A0A0G4I4N9_9ALVE|eukprot:Cvel_10946.t1-p1 / transcript=Cvel_10946.t1 / gene=Cvel_10946 / organism=Chromera_velia_CCMP2878 / gene_product=High affinity nitrate transporter 2.5, putative / transcript_product=High affinity nitrate transporter 2.5, putative / location=Cvel_scaffold673:30264-33392(-) / protein_length=487 / sequence_SO=supercontig / SO=protein_coding / is_pseudo=false
MSSILGLFGRPPVDASGKAKKIHFLDTSMPNMRGFHFAWICFHVAFIAWYALAPMGPILKKNFPMSDDEWALSVTYAVASTIILRFAFGPICDTIGPRLAMASILILGAIPVACYGLCSTINQFYFLRFCIGYLGAAFVPCQFFTAQMFAPSCVGTANAISGGWGNLGGGVTALLMPALFRMLQSFGLDEKAALNYCFIFPALLCVIAGVCVLLFTEDCPQGDWKNRALPGETAEQAAERCRLRDEGRATSQGASQSTLLPSLYDVVKNFNTITLVIHYFVSFGVEMCLNNFMPIYLLDEFKNDDGSSILSFSAAASITALFAWMNLFARATGGILSDNMNKQLSMSGRLITHFAALVGEGIFLFLFTLMPSIGSTVACAVVFSIFAQMANGTNFSIVPSVSPYKGMISGLVGAGGNIGVMVFALMMKSFGADKRTAFRMISFICFGAAALTPLINIGGQWIVPNKKTQEAVEEMKAAEKKAYGTFK